jgi:hypothetical protein
VPSCPPAQEERCITVSVPLLRSGVHRSKLGVAIAVAAGPLRRRVGAESRQNSIGRFPARADTSNLSPKTSLPRKPQHFGARGLGLDKRQGRENALRGKRELLARMIREPWPLRLCRARQTAKPLPFWRRRNTVEQNPLKPCKRGR